MEKQLPFQRKVLFSFIAILIFSLLILIIGEVSLRAFRHLTKHQYPTKTILKDKKLGWRATENYFFEGTLKDLDGASYSLHLTTDSLGFRQFDANSDSLKIWFIGDSFTQAIEVSDNKTYYYLVGDSLKVNIFAYGGRGFGTLQEYQILDKYYDLIKPDIVVLQFCSNDFINNDFDLEKNSFYNNNRMTRPYWKRDEKKSIQYQNPSTVNWGVIGEYSQFLPFFTTKVERIFDRIAFQNQKHSESKIETKGLKHPPFQNTFSTTEILFQKIQQRLSDSTRLIVFDVHEYQPYKDVLIDICEKNNIERIDNLFPALKKTIQNGKIVYSKDGAHWNEEGHQVVANTIIRFLEPPQIQPE